MRWAEYTARIAETRKVNKFLPVNLKGRGQ